MTLLILQAQNETNVVFVPRTIQIFDEAMTLGEIVISGQHGTVEVTEANHKTQSQNTTRSANGTSGHLDQQTLFSGQGDAHNSTSLDDVDMKSWSAMSSQKRSKVRLFARCRCTHILCAYFL